MRVPMGWRFFHPIIGIVAILATPVADPARASELARRMEAVGLSAERLFYPPRTEIEKSLYRTGLHYHWQMYGTESTPHPKSFRGYTLFADPYHSGMKRISFLLGSDCSHFVHRVFQLLGAGYSYAKTRHFIQLGRILESGTDFKQYYLRIAQEGSPIDLSLEALEELASRFEKIPATPESLKPGDIVVHAEETGPRGIHGHMCIITRAEPGKPLSILHAGGSDHGIESSTLFESDLKNSIAFRWRGELFPLKGTDIESLLQAEYEFNPTRCAKRLNR